VQTDQQFSIHYGFAQQREFSDDPLFYADGSGFDDWVLPAAALLLVTRRSEPIGGGSGIQARAISPGNKRNPLPTSADYL
jgi:hypothetical protein